MPEPLKNLYSKLLINEVGEAIYESYPDFDRRAFKQNVFDEQWPERELKARMMHIAESMHLFLPESYTQAASILEAAGSSFSGIEHLIFPAYIERFGLDDYETSINALETMTPYSSSELAVRPFIIKYGERMMSQMHTWAESENQHVRRLASEGCRPRLPWAMALPAFKDDPSPVLAIIEKLLNDESEYVRRSVANNLNDISKDNPETLLALLHKQSGKSKQTDRLLKHASRSLLKQGGREALDLFGFYPPKHVQLTGLQVDKSVSIGNRLSFSFRLHSKDEALGKLRIEYAIDFMKANGKQARKLFKVSEADYTEKTKSVSKQHSFKLITTRRYYPGRHDLAVIVNGQQLGQIEFLLLD